jgi:hypothetical protein
MKVLAEGKWKIPWQGERDCKTPQCGAKLLVEETDLIAIDHTDAFGFVCPICGKTVRVPAGEIPERIKEKLNKTRKYASSYDR